MIRRDDWWTTVTIIFKSEIANLRIICKLTTMSIIAEDNVSSAQTHTKHVCMLANDNETVRFFGKHFLTKCQFEIILF